MDYARCLSWEVCILRARQFECSSCICPDACVCYVNIAGKFFVCVLLGTMVLDIAVGGGSDPLPAVLAARS